MKRSPSPPPPSGVTPAPGLPSTQERLRECAPVRITSDGSRVRLARGASAVEVGAMALFLSGGFLYRVSADHALALMVDGFDLVAQDISGERALELWRGRWQPIARGEALEVTCG